MDIGAEIRWLFAAVFGFAKAVIERVDDLTRWITFDPVPDSLAIPTRGNDPVAPEQSQMLRHRRITNSEEFSQLPDGMLAVRKTAQYQQTVTVGQRLEQFARNLRPGFHGFRINLHRYEYTDTMCDFKWICTTSAATEARRTMSCRVAGPNIVDFHFI